MLHTKDLTIVRNSLSVLIAILALVWIWATKEQHWLKDYIEPAAMLIGSLIVFCQFLISRWGGNSETNQTKSTNYNIPNTTANKNILHQAETAISKAQLFDALQLLSKINNTSVQDEVTLLNARLAKHIESSLRGVQSRDENDRTLNQLNEATLTLVNKLQKELETNSSYQKTIKDYLITRYTNRLDQKMASRQPINLRLVPTTEGTSDETSATFEPISPIALKGHITEVFQEVNGRLLITGVPGTGKTIVLLELALGLLEKESDDLPVVLNLATWKKEFTTFDTWLLEILPAEIGVSKQLAADILKQDQLILLLDGFDEINEDDRKFCFETIGRYGAIADRKFAITSRIEEYKAAREDAPVYQQIQVGTFTISQIETELQRIWDEEKQPEAKPLLQAIHQNTELSKAVEIPFYFNSLQLLFAGGIRLSDLQLENKKVEEIQATITEQFINYELTSKEGYTQSQSKQYLSFLSYNMTKRNKVVFELVDLQYDWYTRKWSNWIKLLSVSLHVILSHNLNGGLFFGLSIGLFLGLSFGLYIGNFRVVTFVMTLGIVFGIFFGIIIGMIYGIINGLKQRTLPYIKTIDRVKWNISLLIKHLSKGTVRDLIFCLIVCLIIFLIDVLNPVLISVLIFVLIFVLSNYIQTNNTAIIQINKPYERFNASMRVLHFSILQHYHLMYLLNKKGLLPYKIVPFLNTMTTHHILESGGATWRFRHRILQEYFAGLYNENDATSE